MEGTARATPQLIHAPLRARNAVRGARRNRYARDFLAGVLYALAVGATDWFAPTALAAELVVISEFSASNERGIVDIDGETSDWIEVANLGSDPADLDGWFLTDESDELAKWRFPAIVLPAGSRIVVFASGRDRRGPSGELHTNFQLADEGEFLALVHPDGVRVAAAFDPAYPFQFADISYGIAEEREDLELIAEGASARYTVPSDGSLGTSWRLPGFSDTSWSTGALGLGYDGSGDYEPLIGTSTEGVMRNVRASVYARVPFVVEDPRTLERITLALRYDDGFVAWVNGIEVARANAPASPSWNSNATAEHGGPQTGELRARFENDGVDPAWVGTAHGADFPPRLLSGGPTGRYLELLRDSTGSLTNTVGFPRIFGPAESIRASFDFRMSAEAGHTGCCGERADGFGFAMLDTTVYGTSGAGPTSANIVWERPRFPSTFSVGFDIFDGTGTENTVSINWNAVEVAARRVDEFPLNAGHFHRAEIIVESDGGDAFVSVLITPNVHGGAAAPFVVFDRERVLGLGAFESRAAFGGRTGSAFTALDIDNVEIEYSSSSSSVIEEERFDLTPWIDQLAEGTNILAIQGLNRAASDDEFLLAPRVEAVRGGNAVIGIERYFPEPTPGERNGSGVDGFAASPVPSRAPGGFSGTIDVALSASTGGAEIRYTTNRSVPTATSTRYTGPIRLSSTTVIRARTFHPSLIASPAVTLSYFQVAADASSFGSNLPLVLVETFGQGIGDAAQTGVFAAFIDVESDRRSRIQGPADFQGAAGMKRRGSSSLGFPKAQWAFETWDDLGGDRETSILGFPDESDYILYGPYSDKSLIRNVLAYSWSNRIGRYASRTKLVELYLSQDGANIRAAEYQGVYVFLEKLKRDSARIDIAKLLRADRSEPEISGGYIIKKDRLDPGDAGFLTSRGQQFGWVEPKEDEIAPEQAAWFVDYMRRFESALYGPNFRDPELGYRAYIAPESFIDHHILTELLKNIDGYRLSTYYYKDRGEKLRMGPLWDFNLSLGNANYLEGWSSTGWYWPLLGSGDYPYFSRLFEDPEFRQRYADRWTALRQRQLSTPALLGEIDEKAALLDESQRRNFSRWQILGSYVWPNWFIASTWAEEIVWMKGWLSARLLWIDGTFVRPPIPNHPGGLVDPGLELVFSAPADTIWYTTDGSDPRLPGGSVSPSAIAHGGAPVRTLAGGSATSEVRVFVPVDDSLGASWVERGFADTAWPRSTVGVGVGYEASSGYESWIDFDVRDEMHNSRNGVYARVPFVMSDPDELATLTLRMRYDDGFIAYLNGVEIARANAPAAPTWNSNATSLHDDTLAVEFESFDVSTHVGRLIRGTNILAIHGLNESSTSSDFLIEPELLGSVPANGEAIIIDRATHIIARAHSGGAVWSGKTVATFVTDPDLPVRISEISYHPRSLPEGSPIDGADLEFIELFNIGGVPMSLAGASIDSAVSFTFSDTVVPAGGFVLVVRDIGAFESFYGEGLPIAGQYDGNLSNGGERLRLLDGVGQTIHDFSYDDQWLPETDGAGYTLVARDVLADPAVWSDRGSWISSGEPGGSPGREEGEVGVRGLRRPSDANADGVVDLSDAIALLRLLFGSQGVFLPCGGESVLESGNEIVLDANGDQRVDVSDSIYVLGWIFLEGPAPVGGASCIPVEGCVSLCF
jgi:hypothetical protein